MPFKLRILSLLAASALVLPLSGCATGEDGRYFSESGKITTGPGTTASGYETDFSGDIKMFSEPLPSDTSPLTDEGPTTRREETDVDDLMEPLALEVSLTSNAAAKRDYSALDTECHGYGQGVRFDELNRPMGAVEFNNGCSAYNALAIKNTEEKTINLTFDQGYENGFTSKILDTLKEKGVKATFFVVGDYVKRQPELVKRMIDEGHTVGSHSMSHYSMPTLSEEECAEEISSLHELVSEKFGIEMTLFRPPKGEYSEKSLAVTADMGYKTVLWSFAYADWDVNNQPEPSAALEKLCERAHPGAIYLLHSVSETNAEILGDFIDRMTASGYSFSTEF